MTNAFVRRLAGLLLVAAAVTAAPVAAQHVPLTDAQIKAQVEHKLADRDIRQVTVEVRDRVVTLRGTVPSLWAKDTAIEQAGKADDVANVIADLAIAAGESDRAVAEKVAGRLRRYVFFSIFDDVEVSVDKGVATLSGVVTMPYKAQEMGKLAMRSEGVQGLVNQIRTLPVSSFDDQIRYAVASRIYNDPSFWNYAIQVNPPIHIIVENGRVTLTGVVGSEVERRQAEVLARDVWGTLGVQNKLRVER